MRLRAGPKIWHESYLVETVYCTVGINFFLELTRDATKMNFECIVTNRVGISYPLSHKHDTRWFTRKQYLWQEIVLPRLKTNESSAIATRVVKHIHTHTHRKRANFMCSYIITYLMLMLISPTAANKQYLREQLIRKVKMSVDHFSFNHL